MQEFEIVNILDLLDVIGEKAVEEILSDFSCEKNTEISTFVHHNAIIFSKKKISITYLIFDEFSDLVAIFTLANKMIEISNIGISNRMRRIIERFAQLDRELNTFSLPAYLIAQFGKNSSYEGMNVSGNDLMQFVFEVLHNVQKQIGGGIVYLECEENISLLNFYQNEKNCFSIFNERYADDEKKKYLQLARFF